MLLYPAQPNRLLVPDSVHRQPCTGTRERLLQVDLLWLSGLLVLVLMANPTESVHATAPSPTAPVGASSMAGSVAPAGGSVALAGPSWDTTAGLFTRRSSPGGMAASGTSIDRGETSHLDGHDGPPIPRDSTEHPNAVPYQSDRSLVGHILALPSYALFSVTRPLGWGVKYLEREYPSLFEPRAPVRGVLPLIELGGPVGVQGGLALFHHDLFGAGHDVRLAGLYGSRNRYEVDLDYALTEAFGPRVGLSFNASLFTNPERRYFLAGNDADREDDETRYFTRQFRAASTLGWTPADPIDGTVEVRFVRTRNEPSSGRLGDALPPALPGLNQTNNFLTVRTGWTARATQQIRDRTVRGTVLSVGGGYTHDLNGAPFRHLTYTAEIQQYLPLGLLPPTRRLALRVRLQKAEPVAGGEAVPFFRLPGIGGQSTVRSFVFERFVDEGALVANAEYNYPIWNLMDAVVFVDAGQVFNAYSDIAVNRFRYSYGGGVRLIRNGKLSFRFEVATGEEGLRSILTVNQIF